MYPKRQAIATEINLAEVSLATIVSEPGAITDKALHYIFVELVDTHQPPHVKNTVFVIYYVNRKGQRFYYEQQKSLNAMEIVWSASQQTLVVCYNDKSTMCVASPTVLDMDIQDLKKSKLFTVPLTGVLRVPDAADTWCTDLEAIDTTERGNMMRYVHAQASDTPNLPLDDIRAIGERIKASVTSDDDPMLEQLKPYYEAISLLWKEIDDRQKLERELAVVADNKKVHADAAQKAKVQQIAKEAVQTRKEAKETASTLNALDKDILAFPDPDEDDDTSLTQDVVRWAELSLAALAAKKFAPPIARLLARKLKRWMFKLPELVYWLWGGGVQKFFADQLSDLTGVFRGWTFGKSAGAIKAKRALERKLSEPLKVQRASLSRSKSSRGKASGHITFGMFDDVVEWNTDRLQLIAAFVTNKPNQLYIGYISPNGPTGLPPDAGDLLDFVYKGVDKDGWRQLWWKPKEDPISNYAPVNMSPVASEDDMYFLFTSGGDHQTWQMRLSNVKEATTHLENLVEIPAYVNIDDLRHAAKALVGRSGGRIKGACCAKCATHAALGGACGTCDKHKRFEKLEIMGSAGSLGSIGERVQEWFQEMVNPSSDEPDRPLQQQQQQRSLFADDPEWQEGMRAAQERMRDPNFGYTAYEDIGDAPPVDPSSSVSRQIADMHQARRELMRHRWEQRPSAAADASLYDPSIDPSLRAQDDAYRRLYVAPAVESSAPVSVGARAAVSSATAADRLYGQSKLAYSDHPSASSIQQIERDQAAYQRYRTVLKPGAAELMARTNERYLRYRQGEKGVAELRQSEGLPPLSEDAKDWIGNMYEARARQQEAVRNAIIDAAGSQDPPTALHGLEHIVYRPDTWLPQNMDAPGRAERIAPPEGASAQQRHLYWRQQVARDINDPPIPISNIQRARYEDVPWLPRMGNLPPSVDPTLVEGARQIQFQRLGLDSDGNVPAKSLAAAPPRPDDEVPGARAAVAEDGDWSRPFSSARQIIENARRQAVAAREQAARDAWEAKPMEINRPGVGSLAKRLTKLGTYAAEIPAAMVRDVEYTLAEDAFQRIDPTAYKTLSTTAAKVGKWVSGAMDAASVVDKPLSAVNRVMSKSIVAPAWKGITKAASVIGHGLGVGVQDIGYGLGKVHQFDVGVAHDIERGGEDAYHEAKDVGLDIAHAFDDPASSGRLVMPSGLTKAQQNQWIAQHLMASDAATPTTRTWTGVQVEAIERAQNRARTRAFQDELNADSAATALRIAAARAAAQAAAAAAAAAAAQQRQTLETAGDQSGMIAQFAQSHGITPAYAQQRLQELNAAGAMGASAGKYMDDSDEDDSDEEDDADMPSAPKRKKKKASAKKSAKKAGAKKASPKKSSKKKKQVTPGDAKGKVKVSKTKKKKSGKRTKRVSGKTAKKTSGRRKKSGGSYINERGCRVVEFCNLNKKRKQRK